MAPADQQRIVAAARELIAAGGVDALSMRKLAAEVGVAPTAIYWHIGSREDLLNAVLDAMIGDLPPIAARGSSPRARLVSVARSIRDQVRGTTDAQQLAAELGRTAELSFPGQVALTREMQAAGVTGSDAAQAVRAVLFLVGGFILLEDNFAHRQPGSRTTQELWDALDDDTIDPALRKAMAKPANTDTLFDYAVDRLLASVLGSM
ncbi:MAG: TetR family transcriptional regulator [Acidimicrobiia bacterium]|nr:TetR family transcriptional regulator [Acidimicrobiia bacterium]MBV9284845.1 TetR family transcriptional regulator [Acidimicrobiia bacterium]